MDIKRYLNLYTLAGASAGAYYGHSKYGKKHGYKAVAGGAAAGLVAGLLVEKLVGNKAPAALPAQQQHAQVTQNAPGQGEYVDLGFGDYAPEPPPADAHPSARAEYEATQAAFSNNGSLSGNSGDGLGTLGGSPGFDADTLDYSEILGDDYPGGSN